MTVAPVSNGRLTGKSAIVTGGTRGIVKNLLGGGK